MVRLFALDAATANVTNTTFAHKFDLVNGPFGSQEIESATSFPARNGVSPTFSIQTSDIAAVLAIVLVATFVIDRSFFNSRYLVHVGGARREKDEATILDEKASVHEKEALEVEAGEQSPKSEPEPESQAQAPTARWKKRIFRAWFILCLLFLVGIGGSSLSGKKLDASEIKKESPEKSDTSAETKEQIDAPPPTTGWSRATNHPWAQKLGTTAILSLVSLSMLVFSAYHVLFWPFFIAYFILIQVLIHMGLEINHEVATTSWQLIALELVLYFTLWTVAGVTLMHKPSRVQGMAWKAFKWTHAITWWLFWGIMEAHAWGGLLAKCAGFAIQGLPAQSFVFVMRPFLVVYLCSGMVCNATYAFRLVKLLWKNDLTKNSM